MLSVKDLTIAVGSVLMTYVLSIVVLSTLLVVGHGVICCWEPLAWILAGLHQMV